MVATQLRAETPALFAGIDIGGTRTKVGIVDVAHGSVVESTIFPTERNDEIRFFDNISLSLTKLALKAGKPRGAGVSIGSYVREDGSIDGMSSFVRFLTHGYPLGFAMSQALNLPVKVDNDARLIGLTEARVGKGRGYSRVLTLTLGTGIGVGLCENGHPVGLDSHIHLAGHIRVREMGMGEGLDDEPCYCGLTGCFESTCSGTSLEKMVHAQLGANVTNKKLFERAQAGDEAAQGLVSFYVDMLTRALNQYVYTYCPDIIVLAGGVAAALKPYLDQINEAMVASVWEGQRTEVTITSMREDAGIVGAAALFT